MINESKGITLIALIITIIVLLILAGTAVSIGLDGDSVFKKANEAKVGWNEKVIEEESIINDYTSYLLDPAKEYGYENNEGVVEASTLVEKDIINYYYDKTKEPIPCAVLYNDNEHGLQVVALESVRNVILGYNGTNNDPKADEAFASGTQTGYGNTAEEKARWSYNHALQSLKEYAMDYMGYMSKNARCPGAPDSAIIADDTMYSIEEGFEIYSSYEGKLKNSNDWSTSDELSKMDSVGVLTSAKSEAYWIASRIVAAYKYADTPYSGIGFQIHVINESGSTAIRGIYNVGSNNGSTPNLLAGSGYSLGFRPIFTLKDDIKVEKTGHL